MDHEPNHLVQVGRRIRTARERNKLNLHELARLSGVSAPALSRIETGKRDLRLTSLFRIAEALRVSPRDLVGETATESLLPDQGGEGYDLTDYR